MLLILSPAKKLDFDTKSSTYTATQPALCDQAKQLAEVMKTKSVTGLQSLMGISPKLAELNVGRYQQLSFPFTEENAKPALYAFKGDVYTKIDKENYTKKEQQYAQKHLRILSGLYGILRPMDLMQPYRLEMGTKLHTHKGEDLYDFWGDTITQNLNQALKEQGDDILVNLASQEYFKAVQPKKLTGHIIQVDFKEHRNGSYKIIGLLAKRARGMCTNYIIKNNITTIDGLKSFTEDGYGLNEALSHEKHLVFSR